MFCPRCGKVSSGNVKFCAHCGASAPDRLRPALAPTALPDSPPTTLTTPEEDKPPPRPWVRYWARAFDLVLSGIIAGVLLPGLSQMEGGHHVMGILIPFMWIFLESLLLSTLGSTPGKWLFRIRLIPNAGGRPRYLSALSRSFKVWWRAFGATVPVLNLVLLFKAYVNLNKNGVTSWDRDTGFSVVHERIGIPRVFFAIIFFAGLTLLISASRVLKHAV